MTASKCLLQCPYIWKKYIELNVELEGEYVEQDISGDGIMGKNQNPES